jgi:hypothetical protein
MQGSLRSERSSGSQGVPKVQTATRPATYLVIRIGDVDEKDAIQEVDAVIRRLGYCWFAKYGRPVGLKSGRKADETTLCLVQTRMGKRRMAFYQIKAMSRVAPKADECPSYYWTVPGRRRTWIKVARASSVAKRDLWDLSIESSRQPLPEAMVRSMSSHFWCVATARR